ncbi:MAG: hypothetical protein JEZ11_04025 [Desulfobacterales bacterium]|nr:hypothetical protein [Desulfobacterales bacterium]
MTSLKNERTVMQANKKVSKARANLLLDAPFFGSLGLKLSLQEDPKCETMWTDGKTLGYNPDYVQERPMEELKAMACESVMFLACGHQSRRGNRDEKRWKKACRYAVDPIIKKAGFKLPDESYCSGQYAGMYAEQIYSMIPVEEGDGPGDHPGNGQPGNQPGNGQAGNEPGDGSGAPGNSEVRDAPPDSGNGKASQSELDESEQDWKVAAAQAAKAAKSCGNLPGDLEVFIEAQRKTVVDWKSELRCFIEQVVKKDYTWMQPNRRYIMQGMCLPSLNAGMELAKARVCIDASGSVYDTELAQFGAEVSNILDEFPMIEVTVDYFDTKIRGETQVYTHDDLPIVLHTVARGGTDYRPVFEMIDAADEDPKFLIVFSDMECSSFPDKAPNYPVLWAKVGDSTWCKTPPFGREIPIEIVYEDDK